LMGSLCGRRD